MTNETRGLGGTVPPSWSLSLLADLHAGVLDGPEAAQLWPRVDADPQARAIIDALEATTTDLAALAGGPVEPMPAYVAARLDAVLAGEAALQRGEPPVAPVLTLDAARRLRHQRLGWGAGLLTAAAAAIVTLVVTLPSSEKASDSTFAQPPASSGPSAGAPLPGDGSGAEALLGKGLGVRDFGPLRNQERLDACLAANGFDPAVRPAGIRPVTVDGQPGVLVILTTGKFAQYRMVAFLATCGPDRPGTLFDRIVGEK